MFDQLNMQLQDDYGLFDLLWTPAKQQVGISSSAELYALCLHRTPRADNGQGSKQVQHSLHSVPVWLIYNMLLLNMWTACLRQDVSSA